MRRDSFNVGATDKLLQRFIAICCCVLMFSSVAGVSSVQKYAYIGQAAKLFNIDNDYAEPSLYNETETLIASWIGASNTVAHMNPRYSGKIYMDRERNIWIFDVERKDAGRYYLKFGAKLIQHEVDIILTVKGSHDSIIGLLITIMILVIIILVILIIIIVLMYKKLCSEPKQSSQSHEYTAVPSKGSESSKDQVHKWLNDHPDFMDKYLGKLTEDHICKQIHKWDDAYPGLLKNKYLDAHENDQVVTPTLEELSVTLKHHSGTGIEGNPKKSRSTQVIFHASQHSDEDVSNNQAVITTLVEPPVTLTESGNEIEGNQMPMSTGKTFIASQSSDELVMYDTATKPTIIELAVTWCGPVTGTEDNQGQLELSSTCNSPSSVTFSEPGHSSTQPFNNDEQDANPEQNMAPDVRVIIEDLDYEDKCQEPLLKDHVKM